MAVDSAPIRLTELVSCGGCAAKYSAALLQELVGGLAPGADPDLLVGLAPSDDAAVYRLDDERALVFTLDFFPPIVDDPAEFGAIAATNALNDVFAMGGRPLLALSIAVFPESLPGEAVRGAIFGAAAAKVRRGRRRARRRPHAARRGAGVRARGRRDGAARTRSGRRRGARPGDDLYLTKPLGTGLLVHGEGGPSSDGGRVDDAAERRRRPSSSGRSARTPSPT